MKEKTVKMRTFAENPMAKRVYFERTEVTTKHQKGWIEIDTDFTQVYDCFSKISARLKSISSMKLLFWLLSHEANKSNGISSGKPVFERFNKYLVAEGTEAIAERTFQSCFEELTEVRALTRIGRGAYYLNPYVFWRDDKKARVDFLTDEAKESKFLSHNPLQKNKDEIKKA